MSRRERDLFADQARDLAALETDEAPVPAEMARIVERVNADRAAHGIPPLQPETHPEQELYRRARALGMLRVDT